MNKYLKWTLIIWGTICGVILLVAILSYVSSLLIFSSIFDDMTYSSKKELIENYELKQKEINELYIYAKSITNNGEKYVDIEFKNDKNIEIFRVEANSIEIAKEQENNSPKPNRYTKSCYHLEINSKEVDALLSRLDWKKETLKTLKVKLDAANCISVESGEPMTIGFKRNGMGKYFYKIFENPLSDSLINNKYNDGCTYIFYKDNIVLEYGGGAFGMQCFETYYDKK